eukprot:COSAG06_NODE_167_length_21546_cov_35.001352_12_plen_65_part_00
MELPIKLSTEQPLLLLLQRWWWLLPEQERKVRALFKAVDTDGSGSVSPPAEKTIDTTFCFFCAE